MNDTMTKEKMAKLTKKQRDEWKNKMIIGCWNENLKALDSLYSTVQSLRLLVIQLKEQAIIRLLLLLDDWYITGEKRVPTVEEVEEVADTIRKRYIPEGYSWDWRGRLYKELTKKGMKPREIQKFLPPELVLKEVESPVSVTLELMPEVLSQWERKASSHGLTLPMYLETALAGRGFRLVEE